LADLLAVAALPVAAGALTGADWAKVIAFWMAGSMA
jgi:hypothetical protein